MKRWGAKVLVLGLVLMAGAIVIEWAGVPWSVTWRGPSIARVYSLDQGAIRVGVIRQGIPGSSFDVTGIPPGISVVRLTDRTTVSTSGAVSFPTYAYEVLLWVIALGFGLVLVGVGSVVRERDRLYFGNIRCAACGYHVKGLRKCPECGRDARSE